MSKEEVIFEEARRMGLNRREYEVYCRATEEARFRLSNVLRDLYSTCRRHAVLDIPGAEMQAQGILMVAELMYGEEYAIALQVETEPKIDVLKEALNTYKAPLETET